MRTQARARYLRHSPYKMRRVADLVRGKPVEEAQDLLAHINRGAAPAILKVLDSAVANAENNLELDVDQLKVAVVYVDEGPTLRSFRARARGSVNRIRKRTSHVTVVVADSQHDEETN